MLIYWLFLITLVKCLEIGKDNEDAIYSITDEGVERINPNVMPAKIGTHSVNTTALNPKVPFYPSEFMDSVEDVPNPTISIDNVTNYPFLDIKYMPAYRNTNGTDTNYNTTKYDLVDPKSEAHPKPKSSSKLPEKNDTQITAKITVKPNSLEVLEGHTAQFNCSVVTAYDMTYIGWIRNNQDMLYQSLFGLKRYVSFGFQSGQNKKDKLGMKTFWNVLVLYQVDKSDEGLYTCYEDMAKLTENVHLAVVTEEDILKKTCLNNIDCWKPDFQCIKYRCVKQLHFITNEVPDVTSLSSKETNNSNEYGLRFLVNAFISGGAVITVIFLLVLFRMMCRKVTNSSRTRNNTQAREQLVYVIERNGSGIMVPEMDKPPTYEVCVQSPAVAATQTKDETPPPSYRHHKTRVIPSLIPPPGYDVGSTSQTVTDNVIFADSTLDQAGPAITSQN